MAEQWVKIFWALQLDVRRFFEKKSEEQKLLFDRILVVPDSQSAWLILLMCASTRANFLVERGPM